MVLRIEELAPETIALTQAMVHIDSRNPTLPGVARGEVIGGETTVKICSRSRSGRQG